MSTINWQQFGLKENPYNNYPLTEGGNVPINKAFIGRSAELAYLNRVFLNDTNVCLVVGGDVGVGKTSLINFYKYKFKYLEPTKPLFSFRREIEVNIEMLNKRSFLIEIMGSVLQEIHLLDNKLIAKEDLLKRIQKLVDLTSRTNLSASLSGGLDPIQAGISIGKDSSLEQPLQMPMAILEGYYYDLINFIMKKKIAKHQYRGLIIHVNNFDSLLYDKANKTKVIAFFHELRDIMQTANTYYVFLGPRNFFKEIIVPQQRVRGIFVQTPVILDPLSKEELREALNERLELLKSENVSKVIKPFDLEVIDTLYTLYQGDIRSIMTALRDILAQHPYLFNKTLSVNEAMFLLGRNRWEKIEIGAHLTPEQTEIVKHFAQTTELIAQKELVEALHKTKESMSGYYFKTLKENGIIEEKKKVGNTKYWGLTEEYIPLRFVFANNEQLVKK